MSKKYVVEEKPLQAVLDYLATQPFKEVSTLILNVQAVARPLDETKIYSEADLEAAKSASFQEGKDTAEAEEENRRLNLETFSDD